MDILASNPPAVANSVASPFTYPRPYAISSIEVTVERVEGLFVGLRRIAFETIDRSGLGRAERDPIPRG